MKQIQPSVVIGLGGTGVNTITYLKRVLEEQAPDLKEFVRFLAIDIDELKGELPSANLFGDPVRLDQEKNEFFRIVDQTKGGEARNIPAVTGWFPENGYQYLPLTEGARQVKAVGRLGFFLTHEEIARRIHRLTDRLVTPEVKTRFPGLRAGQLNIYIVGSICGGTGAGLFIDTAYELRYLQQQAELPERSRIKGLFALGDVYDAVSKRVLANTYASLREIDWFQREDAAYLPDYPGSRRDEIRLRGFDSVYLVSSSNITDIEMSSSQDFAQLCADMIFLDSGADAQESGDSLSQMIQSSRNNTEAYALASDADGTPRCYSSFGLCKIRFPAERVRDLCAARLAAALIQEYVIGDTEPQETLDAKRKALDFICNEALSCNDNGTDMPDRLAERQLETAERVPFGSWVTQNLTRAYNTDLENIRSLEIGRVNQIVKTLTKELVQLEESSHARVVQELQTYRALLDRVVGTMFQDQRGVGYVGRFLKEVGDSARASREYAQQEMKNALGHEKRLADQMNKENSELASLLDAGLFAPFKREAQREQLKTTYGAIRQYFLNRITFIKMRAAVDFYDGVFDARQRLVEGGEGAISITQSRINDLNLIQGFSENIAKVFRSAYEENKRIQGSPFEILIYDNDKFSDLDAIYKTVVTDALQNSLFGAVLGRVGGSVWAIRRFLDNEDKLAELRTLFMDVCRGPFDEEIGGKSVAQRIRDARRSPDNPIDYGPKVQTAFELAGYYCRLNDKAKRFADLRDSEQSLTVVVGYRDENDQAWQEVETVLREGMRRGGSREILPSRSSDRHTILVYREFSGFPAYTLSRITAYHNSFVDESRRENAAPLQMFTKEALQHIAVPTHPVLSGFDVLALEALTIGIIDWDEDHYYLVTEDEWRRRKFAAEAHARGEDAKVEDRTAGSQRKMGSSFSEVVARLAERLPDDQRLSSKRVLFKDEVAYQLAERRPKIDRNQLLTLYSAIYFEGLVGTERDNIALETAIRPPIVFILKRDFALREEHIKRPEKSRAALLREVYITD